GAGIVGPDGAWRPTLAARLRHWRSRRRPVRHPKGRALLGYLAASPVGRAVRLPLNALVRHLFLIGATGFGKTTLLLHLIDAALREGWAVLLIDCKGDPDLLTYAEERGGEVYRLDGRRKWDALQGNRTKVADRLIAGEMAHSDAKYYPEIMGRYVQTVLGVLDARYGDGSPRARDPHEVARLLAPTALKAEVAALVATGQHDGLKPLLAAIDADYVGDPHTEAALLGFRHRYNRLLEGVIGPTLGPGVGLDGRPALDIGQAVKAGRLVLFSVPTDAYQGQGKKVAMWAILAAQALTAELRADYFARLGGRLLIVVDEFAQLEEETTRMGPLLRMARSAGVGVILAAQGTVDLFARVDSRLAKATLSTILNACSTKIVLRQGDHEDRAPWVEHFGEREAETRAASYDATGEVTGQRVVTKPRPVVSEAELGALGIGQAVVQTDAGLLRVLVPGRPPAAMPTSGEAAEGPAPDLVREPP
ncbi:MAG: type IV secretory system conjugative DNA transfer family protein, partial [Chloroflexota bacterium]